MSNRLSKKPKKVVAYDRCLLNTGKFTFIFFFIGLEYSLGEERANLSAFRTFVRFVLVCSVSSSSWGLRRAAVCDCGTPGSFLLTFFEKLAFKYRWLLNTMVWLNYTWKTSLMILCFEWYFFFIVYHFCKDDCGKICCLFYLTWPVFKGNNLSHQHYLI